MSGTQEYQVAGSIAYIGGDSNVTGVALVVKVLEDEQVIGSATVTARVSDDPMESRVFDCSIVAEVPNQQIWPTPQGRRKARYA